MPQTACRPFERRRRQHCLSGLFRGRLWPAHRDGRLATTLPQFLRGALQSVKVDPRVSTTITIGLHFMYLSVFLCVLSVFFCVCLWPRAPGLRHVPWTRPIEN